MNDFFTSDTLHKCCCNRTMRGKAMIAAAIAVMMLLSLTACGKVPPTGNGDQATSITENTNGTVDTPPSSDTDSSPDAPVNENSAADDAWKAAFEKSLLENYGVKPDHYEYLGNGVYQVYVEIDGKVVPYVAVDSATGDYHG